MKGVPLTAISFVLILACASSSHAQTTSQDGDLPLPKWIVIASKELDGTLKPLREHRIKKGFNVFNIHVESFAKSASETELALAVDRRIEEIHATSKLPTYVLIVGDMTVFDANHDENWNRVPAMVGTIARMKGQPTDHRYGCVRDERVPSIAVGRFSAGTRAEVEMMVAKTIQFESEANREKLKNRVRLLVGHPGGGTSLEKSMAENFIFDQIATGLDTIHPIWQIQAAVHSVRSPFFLKSDQFRDQMRSWVEQGQVFSVYFGHAGPEGLWSEGDCLFARDDWNSIKPGCQAGVMFSSGCYSCQTTGLGGEGYGLTSMRTSSGPVAFIGATGESYAAAGKWAADAFIEALNVDQPPTHLGDYLIAAKRGLAESKMAAETFAILDAVDGSRGKIDMKTQREEHLEMWMLLGDPALSIPCVGNEVDFTAKTKPIVEKNAHQITIDAVLPDNFLASLKNADPDAVQVSLTIERRLQDVPKLKRISRRKMDQQGELILENHATANKIQLFQKSFRTIPLNSRVVETIQLPIELLKRDKPHEIIVRLELSFESDYAMGVQPIVLDN